MGSAHSVGNVTKKFQQTTWNRMQGEWAGGSSRKKKRSSGGAGAVSTSAAVGGDQGSVSSAFSDGVLADARERERRSTLSARGPETVFDGGYGTTLGG